MRQFSPLALRIQWSLTVISTPAWVLFQRNFPFYSFVTSSFEGRVSPVAKRRILRSTLSKMRRFRLFPGGVSGPHAKFIFQGALVYSDLFFLNHGDTANAGLRSPGHWFSLNNGISL